MRERLQGASVLVTGASGFIGAPLVAGLAAQGAVVHAQVQTGRRITRLQRLDVQDSAIATDLGNPEEIKRLVHACRPDVVFHLAAERDPAALLAQPGWSATVGATLMQACAGLDLRRFVTIGSSLEVPDPHTGEPVGVHGKAKALAMEAMQRAARELQVPFSALRTHYVYGPMHGRDKLIPAAIRAVAEGRTLPLTGADVRKRFVYVGDVVAACLHVLTHHPDVGKVYWATSPDQHSNAFVASRIAALMGKDIALGTDAFPERGWDRGDWTLGEAEMLPGWRARTSLDDGLRATIAEVLRHATA